MNTKGGKMIRNKKKMRKSKKNNMLREGRGDWRGAGKI